MAKRLPATSFARNDKRLPVTSTSREADLPPCESVPVYVLAKFLKVTRGQVRKWIEEGELLPAYDLRGAGASRACIRVPRSVVLEFLENKALRKKGAGNFSRRE